MDCVELELELVPGVEVPLDVVDRDAEVVTETELLDDGDEVEEADAL